MNIIPRILFTSIIAAMIWLTIDIVDDNGFLNVTGEVWKGVSFTWMVYIAGILTNYFWRIAYKKGQNEEIYRENT